MVLCLHKSTFSWRFFMLKKESGQMGFHNGLLEGMVRADHPYRKIKELVNFSELLKPLHDLYSTKGAQGIAVEIGFKCLFIQFSEDLSDRQMENALKENGAMKWFCGFSLIEPTPGHTYFCKLRKRIGDKNLSDLLNRTNEKLRENNLIGDAFTFIDATGIVSKIALWEERDRAIKDGLDKLNNENVSDYATDSDARFGCKGKRKFWFGYKRHVSVDMRNGFITRVLVTPANVPDSKVFDKLCPSGGMVLADKGYAGAVVEAVLEANGCHSGIMRKKNDPKKNREKDCWLTKLRMPFEGTFSKMPKKARYKGDEKTQFQATFEAIAFNLKRLARISIPPPTPAGA